MARGRKTGGRDFVSGQSGNPSGHPKGFAEFRAACRESSSRALDVLLESLNSDDEKLRIEAAKTVLERAWGKPASAPEDLDAIQNTGPVASRETILLALEALAKQT